MKLVKTEYIVAQVCFILILIRCITFRTALIFTRFSGH